MLLPRIFSLIAFPTQKIHVSVYFLDKMLTLGKSKNKFLFALTYTHFSKKKNNAQQKTDN